MNAAVFSVTGLALVRAEANGDAQFGALLGERTSTFRTREWRRRKRYVQGLSFCKKAETISEPEQGSTRQRAKKQESKRQALAKYRSRFSQALQDELVRKVSQPAL